MTESVARAPASPVFLPLGRGNGPKDNRTRIYDCEDERESTCGNRRRKDGVISKKQQRRRRRRKKRGARQRGPTKCNPNDSSQEKNERNNTHTHTDALRGFCSLVCFALLLFGLCLGSAWLSSLPLLK